MHHTNVMTKEIGLILIFGKRLMSSHVTTVEMLLHLSKRFPIISITYEHGLLSFAPIVFVNADCCTQAKGVSLPLVSLGLLGNTFNGLMALGFHMPTTNITKAVVGLVNVMVVNPPYVPTPDEEVGSLGLSCAWAGGENDRSVIDKILPVAGNLLSDNKGRLYMLFLVENDPMRYKGYGAKMVVQRSTEEETLHVIKFWRDPDMQMVGNEAKLDA
ncbi:hypothetical protein OSB04_027716 [Centaurea solstitialis]|uniref:Uncharacterized protein n=1 Tax=Centaurea solstitialis TaxID=347529 RepID=A0AA38SRU9_9ASTR|nr:hypothetical protein OSB04_027716 [Centaurea solstitialis]